MTDEMNIFLIEDDELDAEVLHRALKKTGMPYTMTRAKDGVEAFDMLK